MTSPPARRGRPRSGGREAVLAAALAVILERGAGRLTTKEVATRAGVSEGSVFYHFTDRTGLLTAVIEDGLSVLSEFHAGEFGRWEAGPDVVLGDFATGLVPFLDRTLAVLIAAQTDAELRAGVVEFLQRNDFGPHRGIDALAGYVRGQQAAGAVRADVDAQVVAMLLISGVLTRVAMAQMISPDYAGRLPDGEAVARTLVAMLSPSAPSS